jgi:hypothetical protein
MGERTVDAWCLNPLLHRAGFREFISTFAVKVAADFIAWQHKIKIMKGLQHERYYMPRVEGTNYDEADRELLDELHWRKHGLLVSCFFFICFGYQKLPPRYPLDRF